MDFYYKTLCKSINDQIKLVHKNLICNIDINDGPIYGDQCYVGDDCFHTPLESPWDVYEVGLFVYKNISIITPTIDLCIQYHTFRNFKSFYSHMSTRPEKIGGKGEMISRKKYILKLGSASKSIRFTPTRLKRFE